jgi:hypothetical protein
MLNANKTLVTIQDFGQTGIFHAVRAGDPAARGEMGIYIGQRENHSKYYMGWIPHRCHAYGHRKFVPCDSYPQDWGLEKLQTATMTRCLQRY